MHHGKTVSKQRQCGASAGNPASVLSLVGDRVGPKETLLGAEL